METEIDGRWHLAIAYPSVLGWVTVAAYCVTALSCYLCNRRYASVAQGRFWFVMTVCMLVLAVNRQIDLQFWLTEILRDTAYDYGWYENRRMVQAGFIVCLTASTILMRTWLIQKLAKHSKYVHRALAGMLLLAFVLILRACSFHYVDEILEISLDRVSVYEFLELCGLGAIMWASTSRLWDVRN